MKICLLSCHNQYSSKRYFTQKFAEALQRKNVEVHVLSWPHGPLPEELIAKIQALKPHLTASFHQLPPQAGKYFWDRLQLPHWTILLDPVFYDLELMQSPLSFISCVDQGDCQLLSSYHFDRQFFFPHAVEHELIAPPDAKERPIDVIFLGTCYDPDNLYAYWKKNYSAQIVNVLDDAVSRVLTEQNTTFVQALLQALIEEGIDLKEIEFDRLAYYVDCYSRGIDRVNLIRSIKDATIHVYGDTCWREEQPIADWSFYLAKQANVTIHPPVNFAEGLDLLKNSKICLNSMPFFKRGTHERIFGAVACGALPLTTQNPYLLGEFGSSLLFYEPLGLEQTNQTINSFLAHDNQREANLAQAQATLVKKHTWDCRADLFLQNFSWLGNHNPKML